MSSQMVDAICAFIFLSFYFYFKIFFFFSTPLKAMSVSTGEMAGVMKSVVCYC